MCHIAFLHSSKAAASPVFSYSVNALEKQTTGLEQRPQKLRLQEWGIVGPSGKYMPKTISSLSLQLHPGENKSSNALPEGV